MKTWTTQRLPRLLNGTGSRWLPFLVVSVCLAFSAFFEMIEWASALVLGADAAAYLATQGDPWDTQADMLCALIGAVAALLFLSRLHDRQLTTLIGQTGESSAPR